LTLVERMTRNVIFRKIQGKTADNGSEFAALYDLKESEVVVCFTNPYSSLKEGVTRSTTA